jgi:hypothetical protein
MRLVHVRRGMSMRDATRAAELLGCSIERGHHGGEMRCRHGLADRSLVTHAARKDASLRFVIWLLQIAARVEALRIALGFSKAA